MYGETNVAERESPSEVITRFMAEHNLVYRSFGDLVNDELEKRDYPPQSISFMTLNKWANGDAKPNPLLFEWLAENAEDERLRELGKEVLEAMTE